MNYSVQDIENMLDDTVIEAQLSADNFANAIIRASRLSKEYPSRLVNFFMDIDRADILTKLKDQGCGNVDYLFEECEFKDRNVDLTGFKDVSTKGMFNNSNVVSVILPEKVQGDKIDNHCFLNCRYLSKVTLPDGITGIGEGAFMNTPMLKQVEIPDSVELISPSAITGSNVKFIVSTKEQPMRIAKSMNIKPRLKSDGSPDLSDLATNLFFGGHFIVKGGSAPTVPANQGEGAQEQQGNINGGAEGNEGNEE